MRSTVKPVNWAKVLLELRHHGWSIQRIADYLGGTRSRVEKWLVEGAKPRYEDGLGLLNLHAEVTGCPERGEKDVVTYGSHTHFTQEDSMVKRKRKAQTPGEDFDDAGHDTRHDEDKALEAGRAGGTHRVVKHTPAPASRVKGDPARPADAPVNARPEMSHEEAMRLHKAGELGRAVLTPAGWVPASPRTPPKLTQS